MIPERVGVIGLGLIGGSIAQRLAERGCEVLGFDTDDATRAAAERAGLELRGSLHDVADGSEVVVVALPPAATAPAVIEALEAGALVADVASVKAPVVEAVAANVPNALERFLPSHPLAGAEASGWESARADLLDQTVWALCPPHPQAPPEPLCRFASLFDAFDARLVVCDPAQHDLAAAFTSHAPHLAAAVIAASLANGPAKLAAALSGGAFRDMTRVARSQPGLWGEILQLNEGNLTVTVERWIDGLRELLDALALQRTSTLEEAWERGRASVELVDRLRWDEPAWERRQLEWPAWNELIALGREGIALRRLSFADGRLTAEVAVRS